MSNQVLQVKRRPVGWVFWLQWVLASVVGSFVGEFMGDFLQGLVVPFSSGIEAAACMGIAQSLVLRQQVPQAGWWVLATAAGWVVSITLGIVVAQAYGFGPGLAAVYVSIGLILGLGQWLVLRRWTYRAGWWILASSLGWLVGWVTGQPISAVLFVDMGVDTTTFVAVGVSQAITGIVLIRLLQRPRSEGRGLGREG